jgi:Cytochrome P460
MPRNRVLMAAVIVVPLLAIGIVTVVFAQGSGSSRATPTPPKQPTVDEFATSLWQFINREKAPYLKWPSTAAASVDEIESPHGASGKTYFNDVAAAGWKQPPQGALLVRENLAADGKKVQSVSVMYRVKGTAPNTNDWYWLEFQPNGKIAKTTAEEGNKPIAGQVASCIECHRKATGNDFVFSNEAAPTPKTDK